MTMNLQRIGLLSASDGERAPTLSYLGTYSDDTNLTDYTFSGIDYGPGAIERLLIVAVTSRKDSQANRQLLSATFDIGSDGGDVSMDEAIITFNSATPNTVSAGIFSIPIPSGSTGTLKVNHNGSVDHCVVNAWVMLNYNSDTAVDTDGGNSSFGIDIDLTVNVPADGVAFGASVRASTGGTWTWTNLAEADSRAVELTTHSVASASGMSADAAYVINSDPDTAGTFVTSVAVFR